MPAFLKLVSAVAFVLLAGNAGRADVLHKVYVEALSAEARGPLEFDVSGMNGLYRWQGLFQDLFEMPVFMTADGEFVPGVADRWSYSEDGMTLFVYLNPDKVWSGGVPLTAEDFVFSLSRMRDPEFAKSPMGFLTSSIAGFQLDSEEPFGVSAPSPHILQIRMTNPYVLNETHLTASAFAPLPRHKVPPDDPVPWSRWPDGVTNGAYTLESVSENVISLKRNPHAPAAQTPYFERVETLILNWSDAFSSFVDGKTDYLENIPERQFSWFA